MDSCTFDVQENNTLKVDSTCVLLLGVSMSGPLSREAEAPRLRDHLALAVHLAPLALFDL